MGDHRRHDRHDGHGEHVGAGASVTLRPGAEITGPAGRTHGAVGVGGVGVGGVEVGPHVGIGIHVGFGQPGYVPYGQPGYIPYGRPGYVHVPFGNAGYRHVGYGDPDYQEVDEARYIADGLRRGDPRAFSEIRQEVFGRPPHDAERFAAILNRETGGQSPLRECPEIVRGPNGERFQTGNDVLVMTNPYEGHTEVLKQIRHDRLGYEEAGYGNYGQRGYIQPIYPGVRVGVHGRVGVGVGVGAGGVGVGVHVPGLRLNLGIP